jgi:DNA/RNA-binding domain of Phe-tRNA-synthetase-like protein
MQAPPFVVELELEGWALYWAHLEIAASTPSSKDSLAELRSRVASERRQSLELESLASHPPIAALRRRFKAAGCDPGRYRPSSEALLRRVLKGDEIPAINSLVDLNNCLSASLAVPCCVMDETTFDPPIGFRSGREGESYESLKGPFKLEGKPLLTDSGRPCDAPITGSVRVKVGPETERAWLVAYLPEGTVTPEEASRTMAQLLEAAPVARLLAEGATPELEP